MDFQEFDVWCAERGQGLLFVLLQNRDHPVVRLGRRLAISHTVRRLSYPVGGRTATCGRSSSESSSEPACNLGSVCSTT
jgi:hypothetical protein